MLKEVRGVKVDTVFRRDESNSLKPFLRRLPTFCFLRLARFLRGLTFLFLAVASQLLPTISMAQETTVRNIQYPVAQPFVSTHDGKTPFQVRLEVGQGMIPVEGQEAQGIFESQGAAEAIDGTIDPNNPNAIIVTFKPLKNISLTFHPNLDSFEFANGDELGNLIGGPIPSFPVRYVAPPPNSLPIADAGVDQTVVSGAVVTLDGTGSSD
ncbi:hypothetical protein, partial [Ruegeria atlantica]|uniref:hypothetical protein n=1 Tax=Ruegeria atlantica TaxID=81569 RepID=UPI00147E9342